MNVEIRCRDGSGIVQVAMEFHPDGINNKSADILLTTDNWNKTFVIPLIAVVDHKLERMRETDLNFTIKMLVDDKRINSTKFPVILFLRDKYKTNKAMNMNEMNLISKLFLQIIRLTIVKSCRQRIKERGCLPIHQ